MMKIKFAVTGAFIIALATVFSVYAESSCEAGKSGIAISPTNQPFSISAGTTVESEFTVKNMGDTTTTFSITAAPYTMTDENYTTPNFLDSEENYTKYTQIARWIRFENAEGGYDETLSVDIDGCSEKNIKYQVVVPDSIPNGGQYAVILVKGSNSDTGSGIKAIPQVGLIVSARASGETIREAEISDVKISKVYSRTEGEKTITVNNVSGSGVVKNTGNIDLEIKTKLTIKNVFGGLLYENESSVSVLPETTRRVDDVWEKTPLFGLFWVSYSVIANGQNVDSTGLLLIMPFWMIALLLVLLTVITIWVVLLIKRHRARRARLMA